MVTQITQAIDGKISDEMYQVSRIERSDIEYIRKGVEKGEIVILKNNSNDTIPKAIGRGLSTKTYTILSSNDNNSKLDTLRVIQEAGCDVVSDTSSGGFFDQTRQEILSTTTLPLATSPLLQAISEIPNPLEEIEDLNKDLLFSCIEKQCSDGVAILKLNCGLTKYLVNELEENNFISDMTSRNGLIHACIIKQTGRENVLYQYFDDVLKILKQNDVVLAFGLSTKFEDINNSFASMQMIEYSIISQLVKRARNAGVQTIVQTPKILSLQQITQAIPTIKKLVFDAPLYSMGILTSNSCYGYEHISSAIGASLACMNGVNLINCTSPFDDVTDTRIMSIRKNILASKISAHCADLAKGERNAISLNNNCLNAMQTENIDDIKRNSVIKTDSMIKPETNNYRKFNKIILNNYFN